MVNLNKAEDFIKAWNRLCKNHRCLECPLYKNKYDEACLEFMGNHFLEAQEIVRKWNSENPEKTRL